eukprot:4581306-Pleurochrysis_carterae.AAC.1
MSERPAQRPYHQTFPGSVRPLPLGGGGQARWRAPPSCCRAAETARLSSYFNYATGIRIPSLWDSYFRTFYVVVRSAI